MKERLEGFYYGLLFGGFFCFMEYWQEGEIGTTYIFNLCIIPLFAAWYIGNELKKEKIK